jgi:hypothetical protein
MRSLRGDPGRFVVGRPKGLAESGNIDLYARPRVPHAGGIATVLSTSFNIGGLEVLVPRVVNARVVSERQALQHYLRTGQHLGKFQSIPAANAYADRLHQAQARLYGAVDPVVARRSKVLSRLK